MLAQSQVFAQVSQVQSTGKFGKNNTLKSLVFVRRKQLERESFSSCSKFLTRPSLDCGL